MAHSAPVAHVRCPSSRCGELFSVTVDRLGRNMYCPACGVRLTARPAALTSRLATRESAGAHGDGADVDRLPLVVVVDNVRSLWNVGSIFRTADACAVSKLVLAGITGYPPRAEITKTALGAERAVSWCYRADAVAALDRFREEGWSAVVLETGSDATPIEEFEWPRRTCLVVGNEVAGVSPGILERSPARVAIPMRGVKASLNVAVAFGIAAHAAAGALAGQRRRDGARHGVPCAR